jgi:hypothetical protein
MLSGIEGKRAKSRKRWSAVLKKAVRNRLRAPQFANVWFHSSNSKEMTRVADDLRSCSSFSQPRRARNRGLVQLFCYFCFLVLDASSGSCQASLLACESITIRERSGHWQYWVGGPSLAGLSPLFGRLLVRHRFNPSLLTTSGSSRDQGSVIA